jgi:predicted NUDIX family NTP pyrophosphohydrolase
MHFSSKNKFYKAGIIITWKKNDDIYLLLTQAYNNKWGIPKGQLESDETIIDCALREVKEETTIDLYDQKNKILQNEKQYAKNMCFFTHSITDTDIDKINLDLSKLNLAFDSTGIGWIKLNCSCNHEDISINSITRFIIKKMSLNIDISNF